MAGVDTVFSGRSDNAFCAVRPPGHHATPGRPMGFCLLNNVAIGTAAALTRDQLLDVLETTAHAQLRALRALRENQIVANTMSGSTVNVNSASLGLMVSMITTIPTNTSRSPIRVCSGR